MSNIQLFKQGAIAIPSHLRGELDAVTKSLMGSGDNKRISIRGSVFRMVVGGKEVAKSEDRAMNMVIVAAAEHNSRTFYAGKFDTNATEYEAPNCWSNDGVTPDDTATDKQSDTCANCPKNIKGSSENGEARACRYNRRLAVVLEHDVAGDVYGLTLPSASIFGTDPKAMGLQQYAKFLGGHGINVNAVVTEFRFDTEASTPKLMFTAVRPLDEAEYEKVKEQGNTPEAKSAIVMTVAQQDGVSKAPKATPQPVTAAPAPVAAPVPTPAPAPAPVTSQTPTSTTGFKPVAATVAAPAPVAAAPAPAKAPTKASAKAPPKGFQITKEAPPQNAQPMQVEEASSEPVLRSAAAPAPNVEALLSNWGVDDE